MMSSKGRPPPRFRYGWPPSVPLAIGLVYALLGVVLLVVFPGPGKIAVAGIHFAVAWLMFRIFRMGAYFLDSELRLTRMLSTKHIPWSEVDRFVLAPRGSARLMGHVALTDGSLVWMQGIGSWWRFANASVGAEALIDEMNAALPRYKGIPSDDPL